MFPIVKLLKFLKPFYFWSLWRMSDTLRIAIILHRKWDSWASLSIPVRVSARGKTLPLNHQHLASLKSAATGWEQQRTWKELQDSREGREETKQQQLVWHLIIWVLLKIRIWVWDHTFGHAQSSSRPFCEGWLHHFEQPLPYLANYNVIYVICNLDIHIYIYLEIYVYLEKIYTYSCTFIQYIYIKILHDCMIYKYTQKK